MNFPPPSDPRPRKSDDRSLSAGLCLAHAQGPRFPRPNRARGQGVSAGWCGWAGMGRTDAHADPLPGVTPERRERPRLRPLILSAKDTPAEKPPLPKLL